MLNNYTQNFNNSVNMKPACTGVLQKSHPNSFFKRFHKTSKMANWLFRENPCLKKANSYEIYVTYMEVVVLQIMYLGDDEFLCELVDKKLLNNDV